MLPTSPLRRPQRVGSLSTLILPSCHQDQYGSSLSIPTKKRAIQTFQDSTIILGSSRTTPSRLGDWILKSNKHNWDHRERESEVILLESGDSGNSNLLSRTRIQGLDKEKGAQDLALTGPKLHMFSYDSFFIKYTIHLPFQKIVIHKNNSAKHWNAATYTWPSYLFMHK
jgi:hypothetical protein